MATDFNGTLRRGPEVSHSGHVSSNSDKLILTSHTRACTNCARAKAKCSISVDIGGKCERCRRMNKECQPSPPMRKRRTVKRPNSKETSQLEEKLDGLVTLLKSATQNVPGITNAVFVNSPPELPSIRQSAYVSTVIGSVSQRDHHTNRPLYNGVEFPDPCLTPAASSSSGPASLNLQPVLHPALEPSPEDAESYLYKFRTDFVKYLPFIVITPSVTAHQLRQERPILWTTIMSVASSNSRQQNGLSEELRAIFGREAFVKGTRNMDLLLAVLVYAVWDRCHCYERQILIGLVQLATTIIYDLRLDKPASKDLALILMYDLKGVPRPPRLSRFPNMEERRALLGCFLLSSMTGSFLRKGDSMRWTPYSDECLSMMETQKEFESDTLLVQLVKLRLICDRAATSPWSGAMSESNPFMNPPAQFYLKSLEGQLHEFKSNIPSELMDNSKSFSSHFDVNTDASFKRYPASWIGRLPLISSLGTLLMELHNTELIIYEVGLSQAPDAFSRQYSGRLECNWALLNAAKSWIDVFFGLLPAQYVGFSSSVYSTMARCFINLYRLSTFEHPEWDRALLRENIDVSSLMDELERNFSQVKDAAGLDLGESEDNDNFSIMVSKIRVLKMSWETANPSTEGSLSMPSGDEMGDFPMELLDDDWLRDLLGL